MLAIDKCFQCVASEPVAGAPPNCGGRLRTLAQLEAKSSPLQGGTMRLQRIVSQCAGRDALGAGAARGRVDLGRELGIDAETVGKRGKELVLLLLVGVHGNPGGRIDLQRLLR